MRDVLFIQGAGKNVHEHWDRAVVDGLQRELGPGFAVRYPTMPNEDDPKFDAWRGPIETEIASLHDGAFVVGHSVGGTILINLLADYRPPSKLGGILLLAAPFIGDGGWPSGDITPRPDLGARMPEDVPILLYHGDNDDVVPTEHVTLYARAIPQATVHELPNCGHQLDGHLSEIAQDVGRLASTAEAR